LASLKAFMAFRFRIEYLPQPAVAALSPMTSTATVSDAVRIRVFMFSLEARTSTCALKVGIRMVQARNAEGLPGLNRASILNQKSRRKRGRAGSPFPSIPSKIRHRLS